MRRAGIKSQECAGIQIQPEYIMPSIIAPPLLLPLHPWTGLSDGDRRGSRCPERRWAAHHSRSLPYPHHVSPPRCKWQKTLGWRRECVRFNGACQPRGPLCLGLCVNYKELKRDENQGAVSVTRGRTLVYVGSHFIRWTTRRKSLYSFFFFKLPVIFKPPKWGFVALSRQAKYLHILKLLTFQAPGAPFCIGVFK